MKDIQKQVKKLEQIIAKATGKSKEDPYFLLSALSSEVGELCDEIIGLEGERIEDKAYADKTAAAKEIVDVIFNAIRVANHYDIELDEAWEKRMQELQKKFS